MYKRKFIIGVSRNRVYELNEVKTKCFESLSQESSKDKAFEVLKIKEFTFVNGCFQNESNAVFGVFL